jgi:hypothetical protein
MSFTRKHYEECARIIREAHAKYPDGAGDDGAHVAIYGIRCYLSRMFASDNPRFDAERFAKACEPGSAK